MVFSFKPFRLLTLVSVFCSSLAAAQDADAETCSVGMSKFVNAPQVFDSILIHPTCSAQGLFTTTKLAWTIEPVDDGEEVAIYSYPPKAVTVTVDENVLIFDLNDMGTVPDKAGVVIQVPRMQLRDVSVDGVDSSVRIAPGFPNLMSVHSLGMGIVLDADMSESLWSKLIITASNSMHSITGEYLNFQMHSVSSKVHLTGSILGGVYDGFDNEVYVTGRVRDLPVVGSKNRVAAGDCESVVIDSLTSSCTILEEGEAPPLTIPSIPCMFAACKRKCFSTNYGYCHCTEDCDTDEPATSVDTPTTSADEQEKNIFKGEPDKAASGAVSAFASSLAFASFLAVLAVLSF